MALAPAKIEVDTSSGLREYTILINVLDGLTERWTEEKQTNYDSTSVQNLYNMFVLGR